MNISYIRFQQFFYLLLFLSFSFSAQASIDERQKQHITTALSTNLNTINVMPIQAYEGVEIDRAALNAAIDDILDSENPDFHLTKLIRILFFTDEYDDEILDVMAQFPMWVTSGEDTYTYWSENHMIMWMSTHWLLSESYNWNSTALRARLVQYLNFKVEYGFYEFYSPTYFPYTLSGLLNLADFSQDEEIKSLATQASIALMNSISELVNDEGIFLPAAGRSYGSKYTDTTNQNHDKAIYVLLGLGDAPSSASAISSFVTTTSVDFTEVDNGWNDYVSKSVSIGHSIAEGTSLHNAAGLRRIDRVMFQWSHGCYLHPDCVEDTNWAWNTYNLGSHSAFEDLSAYIPSWDLAASGAANIATSFSRSSNLSSAQVNIYKSNGVTLSSIDDYYGGYFGYQQFPLVAAVGDIAVFIQSGEVVDWEDRENDYFANTHLPRVDQDGNLAMAMFWPNAEITIGETVAGLSTDVALYWPGGQYDERANAGNWEMAARNGSYVAVLRPCTGTKNGIYGCSGESGRQMWAIYVSNELEVGSFENFVDIVENASYRTSYTYNFWLARFEYYARVTINGKELKRTWTDPLL